MTSSDDKLDNIENEATDWLVLQMAGPLNPADALVFECWLQRSARHRAIYEGMRWTWDDLASLQQQPGDLLRHTAGLHDGVHQRQMRRRRQRVGAALAMAASLTLALLLTSFWFGDPVVALMADHTSPPGEIRTVMLPDGSRVDLGPSTAIRLHFTAAERRVELLTGSAYFTVAPQATAGGRSFVVATDDLSARALGTQFLVERLPHGEGVAVAEHDVEVTLADRRGPQQLQLLSPGQSLRYRKNEQPAATLASIEPQNIAAWRSGNLVFYQQPLQEVVAELNRYRRSRILLTDDALSARVVSGVVRAGDPDEALQAITRELGLKVAVLPFVVIIYK